MATTNNNLLRGIVKLTVKETGNKKYPRPASPKAFPLIYKSQTFLANGLTSGVTESQIKDLVKSTVAYYDIKYVFYPAVDPSKPGVKSNDFDLSTLEILAPMFGSQDFKVFTAGEVREEVLEWIKEIVSE